MSQGGEIDVIGAHPEIPTEFIADSGTAVPIMNQIELLGEVVANAGIPFESVASGNTVTYQVQLADETAVTDATKVGVSAFDSGAFTVDANGFVTLNGGGAAATDLDVDAHTAPGTDPVVPDGSGHIIITGAQVATGTIGANVIRSNSLAANSVTMEIQRSTAVAATDSTKNGVSHFNSANFTVDASGFVSLAGGGLAIDSIHPDSGTDPVVPTGAGLVNIVGSGSTTTVGSLNTLTIQLTGLTNHALLVGAGTTTITKVGPTATAGQYLQSGGAAADPVFSTATLPSTATGAGKVLVADGTNWVASTPTFPNASATSGKIIQSDGTNWIASTPTYPTTAGTASTLLRSDGTNFVNTTATYPSTATGTGTILRADGTNWVATTSTYPNTNAVNTLLYASSANVMAALATANGGVLTTDSSGVPSIDTTNFVRLTTGMQVKGNNTNTAPPAGFLGEQITSGFVSGVSISNATPKTVTSITLTAGIWDITMMLCGVGSANATTLYSGGISTTTNSLTGLNNGDTSAGMNSTGFTIGTSSLCVPNYRVVISSSITYYAVLQVNFGSGTMSGQGRISAVRVG